MSDATPHTTATAVDAPAAAGYAAPRAAVPDVPTGRRRGRSPQQLAFLVVLGIALVVSVSSNIRSGQLEATAGDAAVDPQAAQQRTEEAVAHRDTIVALTERARGMRSSLLPMLQDLGLFLPPGEVPTHGVSIHRSLLAEWGAVASDAVDQMAATPEAPDGVEGIASVRDSLETAVGLLDDAVRAATEAMDASDADTRRDLLEQASEQRDLGVRVWSIGATQLDRLNVAAGNGHQHVFLEIDGTGALTPDAG